MYRTISDLSNISVVSPGSIINWAKVSALIWSVRKEWEIVSYFNFLVCYYYKIFIPRERHLQDFQVSE